MFALVAIVVSGCGASSPRPGIKAAATVPTRSAAGGPAVPTARPQVVEPAAGVGSSAGGAAASADASVVSVGAGDGALAQPVSDAVIRRELSTSGITPNADQATLTPDGLAVAPIGAPLAVQEIIQAGNEIAKLPYRWGGGHGTYADTAYDCSGSISYVFAAAGLLRSTVVSGQLVNYGDAGPGRWVTVFANGGHTFMYVAGLRFDTVALAETGTRWSARSADEPDLSSFAVRHPPGL